MTGPDDGAPPPMLVIRGDASTEEVAALVAALQAVAARSAADARPGPRVVPEWAAPRRLVHGVSPVPGPGAWRASGLPGW
ncbi:MAG TPA: acyl-CoA carboxylase epsilon subunit [Nocardioidaceae bacterium]|nr:acyl-CoA carboxylase epsilon subunit [Nocardioidaceae bacterium]